MELLDHATEQADQGQNSPKPQGDNHDTLVEESGSKVDSKPLGNFYFKRYRATWILLVFFIVMVALAFFVYPRRSVVYRPQSFTVIVQTQGQVQSIGIQVKRLKPDQFSLTIGILANTPGFQGKEPLLLSITLPGLVTPQSCKPPSCTSILSDPFEGTYQVDDRITSLRSYAVTKLIVDTPVFAWDANGLDVEAQLPEVQVNSSNPRYSQINPKVGVSYALPPGYDWTSSPEPMYTPKSYIFGDPSGLTEALIWREFAKDLENPVPINGTDNSTASGDSFRTFISGALLGVAGGALVGAIQEATHTKRRTKRPEPIPE